jgi:hypothetical protein
MVDATQRIGCAGGILAARAGSGLLAPRWRGRNGPWRWGLWEGVVVRLVTVSVWRTAM